MVPDVCSSGVRGWRMSLQKEKKLWQHVRDRKPHALCPYYFNIVVILIYITKNINQLAIYKYLNIKYLMYNKYSFKMITNEGKVGWVIMCVTHNAFKHNNILISQIIYLWC